MAFLYSILENARVHDFCQEVMALGRAQALRLTEKFLLENSRGRVLDLGCGTARYAHLFLKGYTGLDINAEYLKHEASAGKTFVCADSRQMPFKNGFFDTIFSVGVFHHVAPAVTKAIFLEMARVAKPDANILVVDFFYPDAALDIPGWLVSKLDRGRFVKRRAAFMQQVTDFFEVVESRAIKRSYPYNLHAILLKRRCANAVS